MDAGTIAGQEQEELGLRHYAAVLWRRKLVFAVTVLAVTAIAILLISRQTAEYEATATVLLESNVAEGILNPVQGTGGDRGSDIATEVQVMNSQSVREAVTTALGWPPERSSNELAEVVDVVNLPDTSIVAITAISQDRDEAALVAQTYAETYLTVRRDQRLASLRQAEGQVQAELDAIRLQLTELDRPILDLDGQLAAETVEEERDQLLAQREELIRRTTGQRSLLQSREATYAVQLDELRLIANVGTADNAQIVADAQVPTAPASSRWRQYAVALAVGLLLGIVAIVLREYYDDRVRDEQGLRKAVPELAFLGLIPAVKGWRQGRPPVLVSMIASRSASAEAYRALRTYTRLAEPDAPKVVQVTSPNHGEGKTTTVSNLAVSLTRAGRRVVAIDCDLNRSRLHEFFGLSDDVGLTSALLGNATVGEAVHRVIGEPQLAVVPRGPVAPDPAELLSSKRFAEILGLLADEADIVLVDGPPVLTGTDAVVLSGLADAVILVVSGNTTGQSAQRASDLLHQVGGRLIGTVLVRSPRQRWRRRLPPRREVAVEQGREVRDVVGVAPPELQPDVRGERRLVVPEQARK